MLRPIITATLTSLSYLSLLSTSSFAQDGSSEDWIELHSKRVDLPDGRSHSQDVYLNVDNVAALRVELVDADGRCDATTTSVEVTHTPDQRTYQSYEPDAAGIFWLDTPSIAWIKFNSFQDRWQTAHCRRIVYGRASASPDQTLLGAIQHPGGFARRVAFTLAAPAVVKSFRLAIPTFCSGVEILEAGTVTEGVFDPATSDRGQPNSFLVSGGAGTRVAQIVVSINGPRAQACDIPLYADID